MMQGGAVEASRSRRESEDEKNQTEKGEDEVRTDTKNIVSLMESLMEKKKKLTHVKCTLLVQTSPRAGDCVCLVVGSFATGPRVVSAGLGRSDTANGEALGQGGHNFCCMLLAEYRSGRCYSGRVSLGPESREQLDLAWRHLPLS